MAEHLASIFGTEKDRVNCPFYFKIGACRHGDRCSRVHTKPTISQTLLLPNFYRSPEQQMQQENPSGQADPRDLQEHYEDFYEDIFEELTKHGEIETLNVCDNLTDHLVGNVYVKFRDEDAADAAKKALAGRFYAGLPIQVEFSPVTDFHEATCRKYEQETCDRGGHCNFMHLKPISRDLRKQLFGRYPKRREPSPDRCRFVDRDRERFGKGGGKGGYGYKGGGPPRGPDRGYDDRFDRGYGGRGRYDDRRGRSRSPPRREGGGGDGGVRGMTDEDRRAMFARLNAEDGGGA